MLELVNNHFKKSILIEPNTLPYDDIIIPMMCLYDKLVLNEIVHKNGGYISFIVTEPLSNDEISSMRDFFDLTKKPSRINVFKMLFFEKEFDDGLPIRKGSININIVNTNEDIEPGEIKLFDCETDNRIIKLKVYVPNQSE